MTSLRRTPFRPPAAVVGGAPARESLAAFAQQLTARGFQVCGVLQQTERDQTGRKKDMRLVNVIDGHQRSFSQKLGSGSQSCVVDEQALCSTAGEMATALERGVDLVILSKFGHLEIEGRGFRQEFARALAEGTPLLCTVPLDAVPAWLDFTGGRGVILDGDLACLWRWWGPYQLYADLAAAALAHPDAAQAECQSLVIGPRWVMVEGPAGCGVAPRWVASGGVPLPSSRSCSDGGGDIPDLRGQRLATIAQALRHPQTVGAGGASGEAACGEAARDQVIALAALNALLNNTALSNQAVLGESVGLDRQASPLQQKAPPHTVCRDGGLGGWAWRETAYETVALSASGLASYDLPGWLMALDPEADILLEGPETPLCDRLGAYGVRWLSGWAFPNAAVCRAVVQNPQATEQCLMAVGVNKTLFLDRV